jgi:DNA modification methylase
LPVRARLSRVSTPLSIEYVTPQQLKPAAYNPRKIEPSALKSLARGIAEFGIVDPLIIRRSDHMVIGGHQRLKVALAAKMDKVPVVYVDVDDQQAAALNVLLNNPNAQGDWDMPKLAEVLGELDANGFDATLTGFDDKELERLLTYYKGIDGKTDPDEVPEPPKEPVSKSGDLYRLGSHRLMCGDATNAEHVKRLLGDDVPLLMVTDPPYGVEYDPNWRNEAAAKGHLAYAASRVGKIQADDRVDWSAAWALFPGDVAYTWSAPAALLVASGDALLRSGFDIRATIIWRKPHFPISRGHYTFQHEPCWYAVRKGRTAHWQGDHTQSTVWEVALDRNVEGGHSTQKPVEVMEHAIRNHDSKYVYDPFAGTGTTIIAAERQLRSCLAIDIDPQWVDVAVRRWENYTGRKAELVSKI